MKKKLGIVLGIVVVLLAVFCGVVALQPSEFSIERSAQIAAAPATVFALVNDFHHWDGWSPWAKLDPDMKTTYTGPQSGVDAAYAWVGNSEVGEGKMTITESAPSEKIVIRLEFMKPFEATNEATFTFVPVEGGTRVTWRMDGTNNFVGKAFGLLMDMDTMVGGSFEQGLDAMKGMAESTDGGDTP